MLPVVPDDCRMPAEEAPQDRRLTAWPCRAETWWSGLGPAREAFAGVVRAIARRQPVTLAVRHDDRKMAQGLIGGAADLVVADLDVSWMGDIGRPFPVNQAGELAGPVIASSVTNDENSTMWPISAAYLGFAISPAGEQGREVVIVPGEGFADDGGNFDCIGSSRRAQPHASHLLRADEALLHEETLFPGWMVFDLAEHVKAELFVEATRLKTIGVEPDTDAVPGTSNRFRLPHDFRAETVPACLLGDEERFDDEPAEHAVPPKAAERRTRFALDQDRQRLDQRRPCRRRLELDKALEDELPIGPIRRFGGLEREAVTRAE